MFLQSQSFFVIVKSWATSHNLLVKYPEFENQKQALINGTEIIICTPGRLLAHLKFDYFDTNFINHLILDEADRMLDMGFYDDIIKIVNKLPKKRQTLLFSATMPKAIRKLAKNILSIPNLSGETFLLEVIEN